MIAKAAPVLTSFLQSSPNLLIGIGVSVFFHTTVLSLHFTFPETSRTFQDRGLEIILVNSQSSRRPTDPQALAQVNLDGGGTADDNRRRASPLPPSSHDQSGTRLMEQARQRAEGLEARTQHLLADKSSNERVAPVHEQRIQPETAPPSIRGHELANRARDMAREIARLEGEIARNTERYNRRPRITNLGLQAQGTPGAQYKEDWRVKVERIGTLNYPQAGLHGSLILTVQIRDDGSVKKIEIDRSSGHKVLDNAAIRIVEMSAPFARFPPALRQETDIVEITRTWNFTRSSQLQTVQQR